MQLLALLATSFGIGFLAGMSPGPDTVLVLRSVARAGRSGGYLSALGIGAGLLIHSLLTVALVFAGRGVAPRLVGALQVSGSAYLTYLGIRLLRSGGEGQGIDAGNNGRMNEAADHYFMQGFMTNLLNPKAVLFYLSMYGRDVVVHGSKARGKGVLRCQIDNDDKRDNREVPAWIFDASRCAQMHHSSWPHVSWQALLDLRLLLRESVPTGAPEKVENRPSSITEGTNETWADRTESGASSGAIRSTQRSTSVVGSSSRQPEESDRSARANAEGGPGSEGCASSPGGRG